MSEAPGTRGPACGGRDCLRISPWDPKFTSTTPEGGRGGDQQGLPMGNSRYPLKAGRLGGFDLGRGEGCSMKARSSVADGQDGDVFRTQHKARVRTETSPYCGSAQAHGPWAHASPEARAGGSAGRRRGGPAGLGSCEARAQEGAGAARPGRSPAGASWGLAGGSSGSRLGSSDGDAGTAISQGLGFRGRRDAVGSPIVAAMWRFSRPGSSRPCWTSCRSCASDTDAGADSAGAGPGQGPSMLPGPDPQLRDEHFRDAGRNHGRGR